MTLDTVEVYPDEAGNWRWRRLAPNGRIISTSGESFDGRFEAERSARRANPDGKLVFSDQAQGAGRPEADE